MNLHICSSALALGLFGERHGVFSDRAEEVNRFGRFRSDEIVSSLVIISWFAISAFAFVAARTASVVLPGKLESPTPVAGEKPAPPGHPPRRIFLAANVLPPLVVLSGSVGSIVATNTLGRAGADSGLLQEIFPGIDAIPLAGRGSLVDPEQIFNYDADTVLGWTRDRSSFSRKGFPTFIGLDSTTAIDPEAALWRSLGKISGAETSARDLVGQFKTELAALRERLSRLPNGEKAPSALILMSNGNGFWIGPGTHRLTPRLAFAGGKNAVSGRIASILSLEDVAKLDPDIILVSTPSYNVDPVKLFALPEWRMIRAVADRRVFQVPDLPIFADPVFEPILLNWLAEILHPGLASRTRSLTRETYRNALHHDLREDEIDRILMVEANRASLGYDRFRSVAPPPSSAQTSE
jgi:iron complex transport system substrate-binding protein